MARKGVAAKVTRMHKTEQKIRPIARDRDNTDDILDEVTREKNKYAKFEHPDKGSKGTFEPNRPAHQVNNPRIAP